ncbi:Clp protease N-terminal domain-containing protein, partial [Kytococcus sp. HMSC28H12]
MDLNPTTLVAEVLAIAQRDAQAGGHPEITPDHLVAALTAVGDDAVKALLAAAGTTPEAAGAA